MSQRRVIVHVVGQRIAVIVRLRQQVRESSRENEYFPPAKLFFCPCSPGKGAVFHLLRSNDDDRSLWKASRENFTCRVEIPALVASILSARGHVLRRILIESVNASSRSPLYLNVAAEVEEQLFARPTELTHAKRFDHAQLFSGDMI